MSGCATAATPVTEPVVRQVSDLQGATVDLVVGQTLDITTGDLSVESYSGKITKSTVALFIKGRKDGPTVHNPGVKALHEGTTTVILSNSTGGIQNVTFTVDVTKK